MKLTEKAVPNDMTRVRSRSIRKTPHTLGKCPQTRERITRALAQTETADE